MNLWIYR